MTEYTEDQLRAIAHKVLLKATETLNTAYYVGTFANGGAMDMHGQASAFLAGLDHRLPAGWDHMAKEYLQQIELESDPDYSHYLELHKKFGHLRR